MIGMRAHDPISPPRDRMIGENVYTEHWQALQRGRLKRDYRSDENEDTCKLGEILRHMPGNTSIRRARVAASFICWLGTNCGHSIIQSARRWEVMGIPGEKAFLIAWTLDNIRTPWLNSGFRTAEHLLAPEANRRNGELRRNPWPSADDYETLDRVAIWLGSVDGRAFIDSCEREIRRRQVAAK